MRDGEYQNDRGWNGDSIFILMLATVCGVACCAILYDKWLPDLRTTAMVAFLALAVALAVAAKYTKDHPRQN